MCENVDLPVNEYIRASRIYIVSRKMSERDRNGGVGERVNMYFDGREDSAWRPGLIAKVTVTQGRRFICG